MRRIDEGRHVADRGRIEDRDVGFHAGTQDAAVGDADAHRRPRREAANRVLERDQPFVAHVLAEDARERSPRARVGLRFRERPVLGARARIGADRNHRVRQRQPHVVFAHDRDDDRGLAAIGDDEVHRRVARILAHLLANLDEVLPFPLAERRIEHRRDHHAGAAAGSVPLVLPVLRVGIVHVALDAVAQGRILEPGDHLIEAAFPDPQRQAGIEAVRGAIVRIHVSGDVEAARPRLVEALQHVGHPPPVRLVGGLEVPHLRGDVRALGDGEHLVERRHDLTGLGSLVRDVDAAVLLGHFRELDDLVGRGEAAGHVLQ